MNSVVALLKNPVGNIHVVGHLYRSTLSCAYCGPIVRSLEFLLEAQRTPDALSDGTVERSGELDAPFSPYIGPHLG